LPSKKYSKSDAKTLIAIKKNKSLTKVGVSITALVPIDGP